MKKSFLQRQIQHSFARFFFFFFAGNKLGFYLYIQLTNLTNFIFGFIITRSLKNGKIILEKKTLLQLRKKNSNNKSLINSLLRQFLINPVP